MSLFSPGDDLSERTRRFGCLGSAALMLTGFGLIVWGVSVVKSSETNWIGWTAIAVGIVFIYIGGGLDILGSIWWP